MSIWCLIHKNRYLRLTVLFINNLLLQTLKFCLKKKSNWTSLMAQWLRIRLPMQGTWVWALVWEDPTCCGATKPVCHSCWACALEPASHNYWDREPRARAPQQEKPLEWEAHAPQRRVAAAHHKYRKPTRSNEDPTQPKINKIKSLKKNNIFEAILNQNIWIRLPWWHSG